MTHLAEQWNEAQPIAARVAARRELWRLSNKLQ
jgi:hypothetical protein